MPAGGGERCASPGPRRRSLLGRRHHHHHPAAAASPGWLRAPPATAGSGVSLGDALGIDEARGEMNGRAFPTTTTLLFSPNDRI